LALSDFHLRLSHLSTFALSHLRKQVSARDVKINSPCRGQSKHAAIKLAAVPPNVAHSNPAKPLRGEGFIAKQTSKTAATTNIPATNKSVTGIMNNRMDQSVSGSRKPMNKGIPVSTTRAKRPIIVLRFVGVRTDGMVQSPAMTAPA
jgi:hypothetical protein